MSAKLTALGHAYRFDRLIEQGDLLPVDDGRFRQQRVKVSYDEFVYELSDGVMTRCCTSV